MQKIYKIKLINEKKVKINRMDIDRVDFERGWILIVYH